MITTQRNGGITFWSVPGLAIGGSFHSKAKVSESQERGRLIAAFVIGFAVGLSIFL